MKEGCGRDYCYNKYCKNCPNFVPKTDSEALKDSIELAKSEVMKKELSLEDKLSCSGKLCYKQIKKNYPKSI